MARTSLSFRKTHAVSERSSRSLSQGSHALPSVCPPQDLLLSFLSKVKVQVIPMS